MTIAPSQVESRAVAVEKPAATAVCLRDLTVTYPGGVTALCGMSLDIPAGSHLCILGASGSGKTTLLGCLANRVAPTAGSVKITGSVATIHQDLRLVKQRTALQNVLHGAMGRLPLHRTLFRFPREERERAIALLKRVGLSHRIHTRVSRLSGGEQQRVAIARALMQDPAILLADEPVASLDNANARAIMQLLHELRKEHDITLISVLHDCVLAETFADRIIGLEAGRLVHDEVASNDAPSTNGTAMGLRGFRRFDACRACEVFHHALHAPQEASEPVLRLRPIGWSLAAIVLLALYAWAVAGLDIGKRELDGVGANIRRFVSSLLPDSWQQFQAIPWTTLGRSLVDTLQMTLIGTTLAVLIAWPLAALAARNVGPSLLRPICRFILNVIRAVPSIVWALLFVGAVGLGPFAGVLALVAYSLGYLTKFFYEAFEGVDPGPPDALREIGASGMQRFLHAVWPASGPAILSSSLFMLEYNVRAASVLGIVGAGGIGQELMIHKDWGNWHVVGAIILMLIAIVLVLDAISSRFRAWLVRR